MKAIITGKTELKFGLKQMFTFDIVDDDGKVVLSNQSMDCIPSNAVSEIRSEVAKYQAEYEISNELAIGTEIE